MAILVTIKRLFRSIQKDGIIRSDDSSQYKSLPGL